LVGGGRGVVEANEGRTSPSIVRGSSAARAVKSTWPKMN
jgi:hypothetical protein